MNLLPPMFSRRSPSTRGSNPCDEAPSIFTKATGNASSPASGGKTKLSSSPRTSGGTISPNSV
eukprot:6485847-Amphidinium_carterae.2